MARVSASNYFTVTAVVDGEPGKKGNDGTSPVLVTATPSYLSVVCDSNGYVAVPLEDEIISFKFQLGEVNVTSYITNILVTDKPRYVDVTISNKVPYVSITSTSARDIDIAKGVTFRVTAVYSGTTYTADANVPVIGSRQGTSGSNGHTGRWYYYAGEYDGTPSHYNMEATQAPYVSYGTYNNDRPKFWMLDFKGVEPSQFPAPAQNAPSTASNSSWTQMSAEQQYYMAEAYFGPYAHLGSFIINEDWIISQQATSDSPKSSYTKFDPDYPDVPNPDNNNFIPVYAVDGMTGATYLNNAHIKGTVYATDGEFTGEINSSSGAIGGWEIEQTALYYRKEISNGNWVEIGLGMRGAQALPQISAGCSTYKSAVGMGSFTNDNNILVTGLWTRHDVSPAVYGSFTDAGLILTESDQKIGYIYNSSSLITDSSLVAYIGYTGQIYFAGGCIKSMIDPQNNRHHVTLTDCIISDSSDERLKDTVRETKLSAEDIAGAPAIIYSFKGSKDVHAGSIAQYWKDILSEVVTEDEKGYLGLRYLELATVSVIDLAKEVVALKEENKALKARLEAIEAKLGI